MHVNYDRYQAGKELGTGTMAAVYQARDPHIDRLVALKVFHSDLANNKDFVQRFLNEAKTIGRFSHPNIAKVYDVGQNNETIYVAMEYLEGEPLPDIIAKKRLAIEEITDLGLHAALALNYAHHKGIVHRNIKPGNIFMQPDGRIKITDFGIAPSKGLIALQKTQDKKILGGLAYISPEQVMDQLVDGRTDIYSLGGVLYEICTGLKPFQGEDLAALFKAITHDPPPEPKIVNPAIPHTLSQAIMKCLHKQPDKRFQRGRALARDLKTCLKKRKWFLPRRH